jgi:hypothetical protein
MRDIPKRWCIECNEQAVPVRPDPICENCGAEQIEPFRVGWDESD